jgi:hypothetical protein
MAGSPIKRQRKLGVRADDGSVIAFPYMPRVAELPRGWRHFGPAQKVEHLLNMSLDRAAEIFCDGDRWPISTRIGCRCGVSSSLSALRRHLMASSAANRHDHPVDGRSCRLATQA